MKQIKIAFLVNNLTVGGVSKVLISLCNQLTKNNFDVSIIILSSDDKMLTISPLEKSVNKYYFNYNFSNDYSVKAYFINTFLPTITKLRAKDVLLKISEINPDILHFHTLPRQLVIGKIAKKQNPKVNLVYTDHQLRISENNYQNYQRFLLKLAYRPLYNSYQVIAVSKAIYNSIIDNKLKREMKEVHLLENSILLKEYKRSMDIESTKNVVYVSRINDQKGHKTLIRAWKKLETKNGFKLQIIGPDESNGRIPKMAQYDNSIEFLGSVSDIKRYLNNATLAVFPSEKEGLPIALLEMMAYELPIIVSDIKELTDIIEHEKEGLRFKLNDEDDLKKKIQHLLTNALLRKNMGLRGLEKVKKICAANDSLKFHKEFYKALVN